VLAGTTGRGRATAFFGQLIKLSSVSTPKSANQ